MKKRILSLFMIVCMLFTMLPGFTLPVSAIPTTDDDITVGFTDIYGNVLSRAGGNFSGAFGASGVSAANVRSIEVTGGKVTAADWNYIGDNITNFSGLTSFTVTDSVYPVADISTHTFFYCTSLTNVNIQSEIAMGDSAFGYCSNLNNLQIPNVTSIGGRAFYSCESLEELDMPNVTSIGEWAFYMCQNLEQLEIPKVTVLEPYAFGGGNKLTKVELPELTDMGEEAFGYCSKLYEVSIPKITAIGERGFYACERLATLKVPEAPPTVGDEAFLSDPASRNLVFVDANGNELTDDDLENARAAYKAVDDGDTTDDLWYGWNIIPSIGLDISHGDIDISDGSVYGSKITQGSRIYDNYASSNMITITGTTNTNKIVVDGVNANITLDDISIDVSGTDDACAFQLTGGANVQLMLSGENLLTSHTKRAGIEVPVGQTISIDGGETDSLTATSRSEYSGGAGIGGTGLGSGVDGGTINISGGNITANGGSWSSGIGGGKSGEGGTINISGGNITATGGNSGIGGGAYVEGGTINITGGDITAIGGSSGIGGGYNNGSEANPACDAAVTIMEAATVKASGGYLGEAISANNGILEAASTAKILTANFAESQVSGTEVEVYRAVYGDRLTGITPSEEYFSTAFTVPAGTYNLKNSDRTQHYTNTGVPTAIDFEIPDTAGIYIFEEVEDAPVLTSVTISGTAQVGKTLTASVSPSGATVALQWKADNTDISVATGNTYVPVTADVGKAITVTATATGEWFGTVTSAPTSPVIAAQTNNNGGGRDNVRNRKPAAPENPGLPYYIKDGEKVFIGFSVTGEYIVPEGVTVMFGENPKNYSDIENHWAKSSISFVSEREIFQGITENDFGPELSMTRGMFVTVIGRLYERSYGNVAGNTLFSDVNKGTYYSEYVAWAHENDIILGIEEDLFAPDREISREQMAAIMFRFAKFLGKVPESISTSALTFTDKEDISDWALEAAAYCQITGIIQGRDGAEFTPKAISTRAEAAAIIERFVNEMLK